MKIECLGVGGAFSPELGNTSYLVNESILVDCGYLTFVELLRRELIQQIDHIFITHLHNDHIGGLEALGYYNYFVTGKRPILHVANEQMANDLWSSLKVGMGSIGNSDRPLTADLETYFDVDYSHEGIPGFLFDWFPTNHITKMPSYGLRIEDIIKARVALFSGDTCEPVITEDTNFWEIDVMFHDCSLSPTGVHAFYYDLEKSLPEEMKKKTWLIHYDRQLPFIENEVLKGGFAGIAKKNQIIEV